MIGLTIAAMLQIQVFCSTFIVELPDCENSLYQCATDDIYTVSDCEEEFIIDNFGE